MAKYDLNIREESIKLKVAKDWFSGFDTTQIKGNIDFSVCVPTEPGQLELFDLDFFLWAEAKKGNKEDIEDSLVQLIITIMKARTYNDFLPPKYLGAFDAEKIAFIEYDGKLQRQVIFDPILENKIDWTSITPSDHTTEEFAFVKKKAKEILASRMEFDFVHNEKELKQFIKSNFKAKTGTNKINITLNRMTSIFNRWLEIVKPTIDVPWTELEKKYNISPADFFLADVISKNNQSFGKSLQVYLSTNIYWINKFTEFLGVIQKVPVKDVPFKDDQKAHKAFWSKYSRPPRRKDRDAMQARRDLLIEPDRRERKGAFFTPHQWVDLSQEYLANVLNKDGQNWQEEYYIWDCCAGTGNLLFGLTEKERIFASTLDEADVTYMKTQDNLLPAHVFQFDFLNDDLQGDKVPEDLKRILKDPEECKKVVIYINPPYAEAGSATQVTGSGANKVGVSNNSKVWEKNKDKFGLGIRELYVQFFTRIYQEIPGATLAEFSKLKILQGSAFADFRNFFLAKLESLFIVPARSFDNVKGSFPIGFFIWNTDIKEHFKEIIADIYETDGRQIGTKKISIETGRKAITHWISNYGVKATTDVIGYTGNNGPDFQNNQYLQICLKQKVFANGSFNNATKYSITGKNLIPISVYLSARLCIPATWINDRDQFYYPNNLWKQDKEFQFDCLAYTLFHGQNRITSTEGTNHWIPFKEKEVKAPMLFESHFMSDFIAGKIKPDAQDTLFGAEDSLIPTEPIQFSPEAQAVMDAGRELWKYYMWHRDINVNASYYDIRRYFQGETNGKMNPESKDETYMRLWGNIKDALKVLAKKIEPKVYLYGFLLDETTLPEDEHEEIVENPAKEPVKKARKTLPKPKAQTVIHYHIDHVDTLNLGDNVENKFS